MSILSSAHNLLSNEKIVFSSQYTESVCLIVEFTTSGCQSWFAAVTANSYLFQPPPTHDN